MFFILFDPTIIFVLIGFFGLGLYGIFQGAFESIVTATIWIIVIMAIAIVVYAILAAIFDDAGKWVFRILVAAIILICLGIFFTKKAIISHKESRKTTRVYYMNHSGVYVRKDRIHTNGGYLYDTIPAGSFVAITPSYKHEDRCYLNWYEPKGRKCSSMPEGTAEEYVHKFRLGDNYYELPAQEFDELECGQWWEIQEIQDLKECQYSLDAHFKDFLDTFWFGETILETEKDS